jgi:glycosyltransferase involved in cell wall biosynthesis
MNYEKVSVVIPCYNQGEYIIEAIDSIKSQNYDQKFIEIIIVNDGSTDKKTLEILRSINQSNTLKILNKTNGHLSSARNYGIKRATSEFIVVLDADDKFRSEFIRIALNEFRDETVGAVTPSYQMFGLRNDKIYPQGGSLVDFLINNQSCGNGMIRKSVWEKVGGYDENMKNGFEDWEFWIRILKMGYKIQVLNEILFDYRIKEESMFSKSESDLTDNLGYILKKHHKIYEENLIEIIIGQQSIMRNMSNLFFKEKNKTNVKKNDHKLIKRLKKFILK